MEIVSEYKLAKHDEEFHTLKEYFVYLEKDGDDYMVRVAFGAYKKERQSFYQIVNTDVRYFSENREAAIRTKNLIDATTVMSSIIKTKIERQGYIDVSSEEEVE